MSPRVRLAAMLPLLAVAWPVLAGGAPTGAAADWQFSVAALSVHSRWDEHDDEGRRLLQERGRRPGLMLGLARQQGPWTLALAWRGQRGGRDYQGQSNAGTPLRTRSALRDDALQLTLWRALPVASLPLQAGLQLRGDRRERTLAGVGAVQGYPERHQAWTLWAGLRGEQALPAGWSLGGELWLGGGPRAHVDVALPQADPVRLPTGARSGLAWAVELATPRSGGGWRARLALQGLNERVRAGEARPLWREGALVGGARQPAHRLLESGLVLGLDGRF